MAAGDGPNPEMNVRYHADVVGSLLGPPELVQARQDLAAGVIDAHDFKRTEDQAISQILRLQEEAGVDIVTDGELRRTHFAAPIIDACDGFEDKPAPARPYFAADGTPILNETPRSITGRLVLRRALVTEEYTYTRSHTTKPIKVTLPAPTNIVNFWSPEHSREAYVDPFELFADATEILRQELTELARLGATNVQFDAPELASIADRRQADHYASLGIDTERMLRDGIEMLNDLAGHPGINFSLHLCRGSKHRGWGATGGYDELAEKAFGRATNFDAFLLEYDDARSGTFHPLRAVPRDKTVVLGIVSTRRSELESGDLLQSRLDQAAQHFPREQLAVSTQCGFASGLDGDSENMRFQREKLSLVAQIAHRFWP